MSFASILSGRCAGRSVPLIAAFIIYASTLANGQKVQLPALPYLATDEVIASSEPRGIQSFPAAQVSTAVMTRTSPETCTPSTPPANVTTFLATDTQAVIWFYATSVNLGDVFAGDYYSPGGQLYAAASGSWSPLTNTNNVCFVGLPLIIAGAQAATLPGTWSVKVKLNGVPLFSLQFEIASTGNGPAGSGPAISAVSNAFGDSQAIAPNTWVMIKGSGLAPAGKSRIWQDSDFVNNQMPTELDGVSVTVNGKKAFVYYISAAQINILTPPDPISGPVQVQVANNGATSAFVSILELQYSPSFFVINGGHYVTGLHADGSLIGPASLYPGLTTPAKAGETVTLYGNGFGPTSPPVVSGSPSQSGVLPTMPLITIGGVAATVQFAGLVSPGLYQINVVVPMALSGGDKALTATYSGLSVQAGVLISVQQAEAPPPTLSGLSLSPSAVAGGANLAGRVTLSGPAPSGGVVVTLSSSGLAAVVPATVAVSTGQSSVTFPVTTSVVTSSQIVTITATYAGVTQRADLTINIPAVTVASLSLSSSSVTGGTSVTGTVRLSGPAQTGGAVVTLRSSGSAASVPSSLTVAAGLSSATFTVTTSAVSSSQSVIITASLGSSSQTAILTVNPAPASPWKFGSYILNGSLTVEGRTTQVQITSSPASAFSNYMGTVINSQADTNIAIGIIFESATTSGNTITCTGVNRAGSNYFNSSHGFNLEPIISGTMTLTLGAAGQGAPVNGTINFTTTARSLTATFAGTVSTVISFF